MEKLENQIEILNLSKRLGDKNVISSLTLTVAPKAITIITGPNGSGKTTLLKMLARHITPDSGSIHLAAHSKLKYVGNNPGLYAKLSIKENFKFFSSDSKIIQSKFNESLEGWQLTSYANLRIESLSKGLQMKASLLLAFMMTGATLILDEPTAYLDDQSVEYFSNCLRENEGGNTYVIATHDLARFNVHSFVHYELGSGVLKK